MRSRETKITSVSGRFELARVRVTEGKITVNVRRKSKGNRLWFELARVRAIESQLYLTFKEGGSRVDRTVSYCNGRRHSFFYKLQWLKICHLDSSMVKNIYDNDLTAFVKLSYVST